MPSLGLYRSLSSILGLTRDLNIEHNTDLMLTGKAQLTLNIHRTRFI